MCELAWRLLDENPKTRIALPTAAAETAAALSLLGKQHATTIDVIPSTCFQGDDRARPAKRIATEERPRRTSAVQDRRRRVKHAE
jgi:hypothetical protein